MPANRCPNPSCEYFNRVLPNNAKVCPMCGTPLGDVISATNSPPPTSRTPVVPNTQSPPPTQPSQQPPYQPSYQPPYQPSYQPPPPAYVQPTPPPTSRPYKPILRLLHTSGKEYRFQGEEGYIGRRTASSTRAPDIDLTGLPHEGIVSRAHARVYWDWNQNTYMIVDTSRNGTYINGNQITSGVHYRLSNGDYLQLGQENLIGFTVNLI